VLGPLLALAVAAAQPASPLEAPQPGPRSPGVGSVVQVTVARAYLDAGEDDGLVVGQVIALRRGAAEAGRCTVEAVAPDHATCTGGAPRPGDTFRLAQRPAPRVKIVQLAPVPSEQEVSRRAAALAAVPVTQVVDKASAPAAATTATTGTRTQPRCSLE
jgi:hypothetical protein